MEKVNCLFEPKTVAKLLNNRYLMITENFYWRRRRDFLHFYVKKPVKIT